MQYRAEDSVQKLIVLSVGEVVFDRYEDRLRLGGAPLNLAYYVRALGHEGIVASRVGNDELGKSLTREVAALGLSRELIQVDELRPTVVVDVKHTSIGDPSFCIPRDVAWDYLSYSDDLGEVASRAEAICFGTLCLRSEHSRHTVRSLVEGTGQFVFCDMNLRPPYYDRDIITNALKLSKGIKMNAGELKVIRDQLGEKSKSQEYFIQQLIEIYELSILCLTLGSDGSHIYTPGEHFYAQGCNVQVRDTVGCGDAFAAAILVGWLSGMDLPEMLCLANNLGAQVATQLGALVDRKTIQRALVAERNYAVRDGGWPSLP